MTLTTRTGVSLATAKPMASIIKENPGPDVAVIEGFPPKEPPIIIFIAANSSSAMRTLPPTFSRRGAKYSTILLAGVIG